MSLSTVPDKKSICEIYAEAEHERVVLWSDPTCGYRGIIAIHSTVLGPAVGGTRLWNYQCEKVASLDALRLSRAMSYKNALAGLPFGGGKAVIIACDNFDREQIFLAHGRFVQSLNGRFITGEDIGTTPSDMECVRRETSWVAGLPGRSGDPSPMTALGVFKAMQACAVYRWGSSSLSGKTVAIQGCGSTGYHLSRHLNAAGAKLIVSDIKPSRVERVVRDSQAISVDPDDIYTVDSDIFAPCAFGGVINTETVPQLQAEIVVGSANNQLLTDSDGDSLAARNILYAPDCVANSGGVINGCRELLGWDAGKSENKVNEIYNRMLTILQLAAEEKQPPYKTAESLARKLIRETDARE